MVKINVLIPFVAMVAGVNALLNPGGEATLKVSVAVPLEPNDEVSAPEVLTCAPGVLLVTSTLIPQLDGADAVPPVSYSP
jgi:hypothetical protein